MGANYSFEVKNIEIWAPAFLKHNNSFIATVHNFDPAQLTYCMKIILTSMYILSFRIRKFILLSTVVVTVVLVIL